MASAISEFGKFDPLVAEYDLVGLVATTGGAVGGFANPFGFDVIVNYAVLRTTTFSTGAANLDIGIGATATTSNDLLFDGIAVGTAVKTVNSTVAGGTNGTGSVLWADDTFLTVTGSASTAGLVAKLIIFGRPA